MRVDVIDPSAFTPPYDRALCSALAREGAQVRLITSRFAYGEVPAPDGYEVREHFYRRVPGDDILGPMYAEDNDLAGAE